MAVVSRYDCRIGPTFACMEFKQLLVEKSVLLEGFDVMILANKVSHIRVQSEGGDLAYEEVRGMRRCSGGLLTTVMKDRNPSQDLEPYDLAFDWTNPDGVLRVRGDFFEVEPETPKKAELISATANLLEYHVKEPGDDEPWVISVELVEALEDDEEDVVVPRKKAVDPVSSRAQPMLAKSLKDRFNDLAGAVATMASEVLDEEDGLARIHIKFLNGRCAQLERLDDLSEDELAEIFYVHWTDHVSLKKFWTSVSAAMVFSVAFAFTIETDDGDEVELLLRRSPQDRHPADDFCEEILGGVQGELEELLNDELKTTVEQGFARLEKLILQSGTPPAEAPARKPERLRSPAAKKLRRNT